MKYKILGRTNEKVSLICLGTMTYGEQNSEVEAHQQMSYALDHGINFFDTAELYAVPSKKENNGKTEQYIGTWFKDTGKRDQVFLATKITGPSANLSYISKELNFSAYRVRQAIEGSLSRLKTDYVDLYQLHWPERKTNFFGKRGFKVEKDEKWEDNVGTVIQTMNDLKKEGKIRYWGLSNESAWGAMKFLYTADQLDLDRPVSIQNPYNLLNRLYEVGLAEVSHREQLSLLVYSPMAFGLLSGKYHKGEDVSSSRLTLYKQMSRYNSDICYNATNQYLKIANEYGISLAQMSLAYVNSRPWVTSNIIGATTMDQLKENIQSVNIELTSDLLDKIEKVHETIPNPAP